MTDTKDDYDTEIFQKITYGNTGKIIERKWIMDNCKLHRIGGPAVIKYTYPPTGIRKVESWYQNGLLCRKDTSSPTVLEFDESGRIERESWYNCKTTSMYMYRKTTYCD